MEDSILSHCNSEVSPCHGLVWLPCVHRGARQPKHGVGAAELQDFVLGVMRPLADWQLQKECSDILDSFNIFVASIYTVE